MRLYTPAMEALSNKQIESTDKVTGHLLRPVVLNNGMILVFSDGRFALFRLEFMGEDFISLKFSYQLPDAHELLLAGLITDVQHIEHMKMEEAYKESQQEKRDRETYLQLKKKFEPTQEGI
jgi:hypothetical protein